MLSKVARDWPQRPRRGIGGDDHAEEKKEQARGMQRGGGGENGPLALLGETRSRGGQEGAKDVAKGWAKWNEERWYIAAVGE